MIELIYQIFIFFFYKELSFPTIFIKEESKIIKDKFKLNEEQFIRSKEIYEKNKLNYEIQLNINEEQFKKAKEIYTYKINEIKETMKKIEIFQEEKKKKIFENDIIIISFIIFITYFGLQNIFNFIEIWNEIKKYMIILFWNLIIVGVVWLAINIKVLEKIKVLQEEIKKAIKTFKKFKNEIIEKKIIYIYIVIIYYFLIIFMYLVFKNNLYYF